MKQQNRSIDRDAVRMNNGDRMIDAYCISGNRHCRNRNAEQGGFAFEHTWTEIFDDKIGNKDPKIELFIQKLNEELSTSERNDQLVPGRTQNKNK